MTVVVGVTGGIAAYKAVSVIRSLVLLGHDVHVIATDAALRFVGAPTFEAISRNPLRESVAAVSCGLVKGNALLDLDYSEDSGAQADANFVLTASGKIVEVQGTAEDHPFEEAEFHALMALARKGVVQLIDMQRAALAATGL